MKILQLCSKPPLPLLDGGCIAMHNISKGLMRADISIKILTISTDKHPFKIESYPKDFLDKSKIENIFVDTNVNIIGVIKSLFSSKSYNVDRFYSTHFEKKLIEILQDVRYDIVLLEGLYMTPYIKAIRENTSAKISLRAHNVEHLIWNQLAHGQTNPFKRFYFNILAKKLKKYEIQALKSVDSILPISNEDRDRMQHFGCNIPTHTVPFGVDISDYQFCDLPIKKPIKLFHIGALNWQPNKEGVEFFIEKIWPKLSHLPVEMHLAGRNIPDSILKKATPKLIIHGEVANAVAFMNENDIMLVPLQTGSGMRIKIIEAMAKGKNVIATPIGAEGISVEHKKNILLAKNELEFIDTIEFCISNFDKIEIIRTSARKLIEDEYSNNHIIGNLIAFLSEMIGTKKNNIQE